MFLYKNSILSLRVGETLSLAPSRNLSVIRVIHALGWMCISVQVMYAVQKQWKQHEVDVYKCAGCVRSAETVEAARGGCVLVCRLCTQCRNSGSSIRRISTVSIGVLAYRKDITYLILFSGFPLTLFGFLTILIQRRNSSGYVTLLVTAICWISILFTPP